MLGCTPGPTLTPAMGTNLRLSTMHASDSERYYGAAVLTDGS